MENLNIETQPGNIDFNHIGWRYYKEIKKKAMEQEFSWSGLLISLSIAFFIVTTTAFTLNFLHSSLKSTSFSENKMIHRLEIFSNQNYLHVDHIKRVENLHYLNLA